MSQEKIEELVSICNNILLAHRRLTSVYAHTIENGQAKFSLDYAQDLRSVDLCLDRRNGAGTFRFHTSSGVDHLRIKTWTLSFNKDAITIKHLKQSMDFDAVKEKTLVRFMGIQNQMVTEAIEIKTKASGSNWNNMIKRQESHALNGEDQNSLCDDFLDVFIGYARKLIQTAKNYQIEQVNSFFQTVNTDVSPTPTNLETRPSVTEEVSDIIIAYMG